MTERLSRSKVLIGTAGVLKLQKSRVAIFGIGGVGGYVAEALVRAGIGSLSFIDGDRVSESNINRQIVATTKTIGLFKAELMRERSLEINPELKVTARNEYYLTETVHEFDLSDYDYIVDAIDMVTSKILLIVNAKKLEIPIISSMGAGNKFDPSAFTVDDIYKTSVCPLAKVMRSELKKRNISSLKVVYSKETPSPHLEEVTEIKNGRTPPGSMSFVPSAAGLILAGQVVMDLLKEDRGAPPHTPQGFHP